MSAVLKRRKPDLEQGLCVKNFYYLESWSRSQEKQYLKSKPNLMCLWCRVKKQAVFSSVVWTDSASLSEQMWKWQLCSLLLDKSSRPWVEMMQ